jgi:hypothetical protein
MEKNAAKVFVKQIPHQRCHVIEKHNIEYWKTITPQIQCQTKIKNKTLFL